MMMMMMMYKVYICNRYYISMCWELKIRNFPKPDVSAKAFCALFFACFFLRDDSVNSKKINIFALKMCFIRRER